MQYFPNGSQFAVSRTLATAVAITALTNANPAVATVADATGITAGSYLVVASNWGSINNRATMAGTIADDDIPLIGLDTTDALRNPQDTLGGDTIRLASDFFALSQITTLDKAGGDQQFFQWVYIDDPSGQQYQRPTRKSARTLTFTLDYDPELPWYQYMINLDQAQRYVILRVTLTSGDQLLYLCYVSFQEDPTMVVDTNMQNVATFSPMGRVTRIPASALTP